MKAEICAFSHYKVMPGHGIRYIRTDTKVLFFRDSKTRALFLQKQKPAQFRWTQFYRKIHKSKKTTTVKKRALKVVKIERAVGGLSLEAIKKKRVQKPEERAAAREAALAEIKKRKEAAKANKAARKAAAPQPAATSRMARVLPQRGTGPKGR